MAQVYRSVVMDSTLELPTSLGMLTGPARLVIGLRPYLQMIDGQSYDLMAGTIHMCNPQTSTTVAAFAAPNRAGRTSRVLPKARQN